LTGHPSTPEFDRIAAAFGWSRDPSRVGDDAALLPGGRLLCCDALAEGVHFRWDWSAPEDVGWKAVAANVADILAMGGLPDTAVWSVGMGADWSDATFDGLSRGALDACKAYGCSLVGGDTVRCKGPGFVSLALLGAVATEKPWVRSGVRPGDHLAVAGELGYSAAGLAALLEGSSGCDGAERFVSMHRRPRPPMEQAMWLRSLPVGAAIDLSDGLASEAAHLALASGVSIVLDTASLAPSPALVAFAGTLRIDPMDWILYGGEDHSLLVALPEGVAVPPGVRVVGRAEEGSGVQLSTGAHREPLAPRGWSHS